jgi:sigma-B regulation protein RsbU (phosphoserine phosphatase)
MDKMNNYSGPPQETCEQELRRCRERIKSLTVCLEVARLINSTLELDEVLNRIMTTSKAVVRADACSLMLVDEATDELVFLVAHGSVGDQLKQGFRLARGQGIAGHVFDSGQPLLIADAYQDPRFHRDFDRKTGYRTRSILCVPIKIKERIIGVSQVINNLDGSAFTLEDQETLTLLCMHAAVAIENARMHRALLRKQQMESDLAFATSVQQSFLPQSSPELQGFCFYSHYQSALEVGGDFYDFIPLPGKRVGVVIGDVSGKGVSSALYMARLTSDFRLRAVQQDDAAQLLEQINDLLCERSQRGMFVTLLYLVLDAAERTITYVNAGHLPPLLWNRRADRWQMLRQSGGPPLGILPGRRYASGVVHLEPGDGLLLTTDGLVEARDPAGQQFGWDNLEKVMRAGSSQAEATYERMMQAVKAFMAGTPQADDITLVVIGVERDDAIVAA